MELVKFLRKKEIKNQTNKMHTIFLYLKMLIDYFMVFFYYSLATFSFRTERVGIYQIFFYLLNTKK